MQGSKTTLFKITIFLKTVALFLVVTFVSAQAITWPAAAFDSNSNVPGGDPVSALTGKVLDGTIAVPPELGTLDEVFSGTSGKMVVYIQDAHDSLEAQENIAKIIKHLVANCGVKTVFEEGYEGPVPTDKYFGFIKNLTIREKVAYFLMDHLRVGGAEYAHINRNEDFELIGADSLMLHRKNIDRYRFAAAKKDVIAKDLKVLEKELKALAASRFSKELKEWIKCAELFDEGKLPLLDYLKRSVKYLDVTHSNSNDYHIIRQIIEAEKTTNQAVFENAKNINTKALFVEIERMEEDVAAQYLGSTEDRETFGYYRAIRLLKRLNDISLSFSEYQAVKDSLKSLDTKRMGTFIGRETGKTLVLSKRWEKNIRNAVEFYEMAQDRDDVVAKQIECFLENPEKQAAALVFGGFHKNSIKEMLRERGVSCVIISPKITRISKRHQDYYKQLMTHGHHAFEMPFLLARAARPLPLIAERAPVVRAEIRAIYDALRRYPRVELALLDRMMKQETKEPPVSINLSSVIRSEVRNATNTPPPDNGIFEKAKLQIETILSLEKNYDGFRNLMKFFFGSAGFFLPVISVFFVAAPLPGAEAFPQTAIPKVLLAGTIGSAAMVWAYSRLFPRSNYEPYEEMMQRLIGMAPSEMTAGHKNRLNQLLVGTGNMLLQRLARIGLDIMDFLEDKRKNPETVSFKTATVLSPSDAEIVRQRLAALGLDRLIGFRESGGGMSFQVSSAIPSEAARDQIRKLIKNGSAIEKLFEGLAGTQNDILSVQQGFWHALFDLLYRQNGDAQFTEEYTTLYNDGEIFRDPGVLRELAKDAARPQENHLVEQIRKRTVSSDAVKALVFATGSGVLINNMLRKIPQLSEVVEYDRSSVSNATADRNRKRILPSALYEKVRQVTADVRDFDWKLNNETFGVVVSTASLRLMDTEARQSVIRFLKDKRGLKEGGAFFYMDTLEHAEMIETVSQELRGAGFDVEISRQPFAAHRDAMFYIFVHQYYRNETFRNYIDQLMRARKAGDLYVFLYDMAGKRKIEFLIIEAVLPKRSELRSAFSVFRDRLKNEAQEIFSREFENVRISVENGPSSRVTVALLGKDPAKDRLDSFTLFVEIPSGLVGRMTVYDGMSIGVPALVIGRIILQDPVASPVLITQHTLSSKMQWDEALAKVKALMPAEDFDAGNAADVEMFAKAVVGLTADEIRAAVVSSSLSTSGVLGKNRQGVLEKLSGQPRQLYPSQERPSFRGAGRVFDWFFRKMSSAAAEQGYRQISGIVSLPDGLANMVLYQRYGFEPVMSSEKSPAFAIVRETLKDPRFGTGLKEKAWSLSARMDHLLVLMTRQVKKTVATQETAGPLLADRARELVSKLPGRDLLSRGYLYRIDQYSALAELMNFPSDKLIADFLALSSGSREFEQTVTALSLNHNLLVYAQLRDLYFKLPENDAKRKDIVDILRHIQLYGLISPGQGNGRFRNINRRTWAHRADRTFAYVDEVIKDARRVDSKMPLKIADVAVSDGTQSYELVQHFREAGIRGVKVTGMDRDLSFSILEDIDPRFTIVLDARGELIQAIEKKTGKLWLRTTVFDYLPPIPRWLANLFLLENKGARVERSVSIPVMTGIPANLSSRASANKISLLNPEAEEFAAKNPDALEFRSHDVFEPMAGSFIFIRVMGLLMREGYTYFRAPDVKRALTLLGDALKEDGVLMNGFAGRRDIAFDYYQRKGSLLIRNNRKSQGWKKDREWKSLPLDTATVTFSSAFRNQETASSKRSEIRTNAVPATMSFQTPTEKTPSPDSTAIKKTVAGRAKNGISQVRNTSPAMQLSEPMVFVIEKTRIAEMVKDPKQEVLLNWLLGFATLNTNMLHIVVPDDREGPEDSWVEKLKNSEASVYSDIRRVRKAEGMAVFGFSNSAGDSDGEFLGRLRSKSVSGKVICVDVADGNGFVLAVLLGRKVKELPKVHGFHRDTTDRYRFELCTAIQTFYDSYVVINAAA